MQIIDSSIALLAAQGAWVWALAPLALIAYCAPLLIAFERRHRYLVSIAVINLATGWSVIGWIAALLWSLNKDVRTGDVTLAPLIAEMPLEPLWSDTALVEAIPDGETRPCPYCAETIRAQAIVCRFCGRDLVAPMAVETSPADLDEAEKQQLAGLLSEQETEAPAGDPRLLDVFEYARLVEQSQPVGANVIQMPSAEAADASRSERDVSVHNDPAAEPGLSRDADWHFPETASVSRR